MSSSELTVKLGRRLRRVHWQTEAEGQPTTDLPGMPPSVDGVERERLTEMCARVQQSSKELADREARLEEREADLAAREKDVQEKMDELARLITSVKEEKAQMLEANEEEIISFSLSITQKVLQYEIENGRYKIEEVVKSALRAVRDRGSIVVRVNPVDLELTRSAVNRLGRHFGTQRITCVGDESISPASCCIETESGKIFSEIPGRLERIEKSLLKKNGSSDGI
jgi:flagellar biosynthesis/type III secretory pathway protein FliH